jgi:serine/threonine-protein kinase
MLLSVGDRLGAYEILAPIGKGGMGEVWKAREMGLDREVALKFLPPEFSSDGERLERFVREARAASALNHPNVVTIYEINSHAGIYFIAMEYIRGRELSEIIRQGKPISLAETVGYALQVADALGKAHRAGIVHRDIKPSNIMLTEDGIIKVLDFGLAKMNAPGAQVSPDVPPTQPGVVMGTIHYMSPEQASGDPAGPPSDVFSTGVVLYEMLSGRRPFRGSSQAEILLSVLCADPPPLQSVAPRVPDQLARIVHHCLQRNPESRYSDASGLVRDLRAFQRRLALEDLDNASTVTFAVAPAGPVVPRKSRRVWVSVAAVVTLGAAAGYWTLTLRQPTAGNSSQISGGSASSKALQDARAYIQRFDRRGNLGRAIGTLEPAARIDPQNAGLRSALAEAYTRQYSATSDKKWLQMANAEGRAAVATNDDLAMAHVALGMALAAGGQNDEAAHEFERARDLDPLSGPAHLGLAKIRSAQGQTEEAERLYRKAIELDPADWLPVSEAAAFYYRRARYAEAIAQWSVALKLFGDNVTIMRNLAAGYHMNGQYAEAVSTLQRALELDPSAAVWTNLGTARFFQGRYADAVTAMEKATQLAPNNYLYWGNLGDAYRWAPGTREKAAAAYARATQLAREALSVNPNNTPVQSRLGTYLAKAGDVRGALAEMAQARQRATEDPDTLFDSAVIYELAGLRDQALAALERSIRTGYSLHEVANEPEFIALRSDPRYTAMMSRATTPISTAKKTVK